MNASLTNMAKLGRGSAIAGIMFALLAMGYAPNALAIIDPRPPSTLAGSCDGFANYADEIHPHGFSIHSQVSLPDNYVQVELDFQVDNTDQGEFNSASVIPDSAYLEQNLGVVTEQSVGGVVGPMGHHVSNVVAQSRLTLVLPVTEVAQMLIDLNSGAVPFTVHADEQLLLSSGVTVANWGVSPGSPTPDIDDQGYANARDNYSLNPVPQYPYDPQYTFSIITANLSNGNSQPSAFDGWSAGNNKYYVMEGPKNGNPMTDARLFEVPDVLQNGRVVSVVTTVDTNANTTRHDVTIERVGLEGIAALYTSAGLCSGKEQHVDYREHRTRLFFIDGESTTAPGYPPGSEPDKQAQPLRFNNLEITEGLTVSGQVEGHILKPGLELRFRNGQARVVGTFDTDLTFSAEAHANLTVNVGGEERNKQLYDLCFAVSEIPAGAVTINVNLGLEHIVGFSGNLELDAVAGVEKRFHELVQVGYDQRRPEGHRYFSSADDLSPAMELTPPQLTDSTQAHGKIYTRLTPKLYVSIDDPACLSGGRLWADITAYGTVDVMPTQDPWWVIGTGVDLSGGIALGLFSVDLLNHQFPTTTIVHAETRSAPGTAPLAAGMTNTLSAVIRTAGEDQRWAISEDDIVVNTGVNDTTVAVTADQNVLVGTVGGSGRLQSFDAFGALQWSKRYNGRGVSKVLSLPNNQVLVAGKSSAAWLARQQSNGDLIWSREVKVTPNGDSGFCSAESAAYVETAPGQYDFILAGKSSHQACIMRIDDSGNLVWAKGYELSDSSAVFNDLAVTSDGGIVAVGERGSHSLIAKFDITDGSLQWAHSWGVPGSGSGGGLYGVAEGPGGMIVAVGTTHNSPHNGNGAAWLLRVEADGTDGRSATVYNDFMWEMMLTYDAPATDPGTWNTAYDTFFDIVPMAEGFGVVGKGGHGSSEAMWVAKINANLGVEWFRHIDGVGIDRLDAVAVGEDGMFVSGSSQATPGDDTSRLTLMKLPNTGGIELLPESGLSSRFGEPGIRGFTSALGLSLPMSDLNLTVNEVSLISNDPISGLFTVPPEFCVSKLTRSGHSSTLDACDNPPTASLTATPNPGQCNQPVTFDASASAVGDVLRSLVEFDWDFGDGSSAAGSLINHSFTSFGAHQVGLVVVDDGGESGSTSLQVNIDNQPPVADAGGPYLVPTGSAVQLSAAGSTEPDAACGDSIVNYAWDIDGDGQYDDAIGQNPTIPWSPLLANLGTGIHSIGLQVTDSFGVNAINGANLVIAQGTDLRVSLFDDADPVLAGQGFHYLATVTNHGPVDAYDLTLSVEVPTHVNLSFTSSFSWTCNTVGKLVTCTRPFLAAGDTGALLLTVADDGAQVTQGPILQDLVASVSSLTPELHPEDNFAREETLLGSKMPSCSGVQAVVAADSDILITTVCHGEDSATIESNVEVLGGFGLFIRAPWTSILPGFRVADGKKFSVGKP